jgi:hypothetical protein
MVKRIRILLLAAMFGALCLELSERFLPAGVTGFVAKVEAIVGRPLVWPAGQPDVVRRTCTTAESGRDSQHAGQIPRVPLSFG